jgi:O-antigen ligase
VRSSYTALSQPSLLNRVAFAALWLLVFTVPWEKSVVLPGIGTVARLVGVCAFVLGVLSAVVRRQIRMPSPALYVMVTFLLWALMTAYWTLDSDNTFLYVSTLTQLIAMVWLIWDLTDSDERQLYLLKAYVAGTVVSAGYTILEYVQDRQALGGYFYGRYAAGGFNPNDLGMTVALSLPISYYLMMRSAPKLGLLYRIQIILVIATIVLTASRSAMVAGCVALLIVPCTFRWLSPSNLWPNVVLAFLVVMFAGSLLPASSWARLSTTSDSIVHGTMNDRTVIWDAGETVFRSHPFAGVGAGAFAKGVEPIVGVSPASSMEELEQTRAAYVAHNTFLSVLVETGLIGFALFCTILLLLVRHILAMPALEKWLWACTLLVWVTSVFVATWEIRKPTWVLFSLLLTQATASREVSVYRLSEAEPEWQGARL